MVENTADAADGRVLRVAFVPGVTPDKWFGVWAERRPDVPIVAVPLETSPSRRRCCATEELTWRSCGCRFRGRPCT